jgi:hypothetical protein
MNWLRHERKTTREYHKNAPSEQWVSRLRYEPTLHKYVKYHTKCKINLSCILSFYYKTRNISGGRER